MGRVDPKTRVYVHDEEDVGEFEPNDEEVDAEILDRVHDEIGAERAAPEKEKPKGAYERFAEDE